MRDRLSKLLPAACAIALAGCLSFAVLNSKQAQNRSDQNSQAVERAVAAAKQAARTAAEAKALAEFGDRVIDLPEDGAGWHTTVFTHEPPSEAEQRLLGWFDADPQLARLKQQTHFHHYTPQSSIYARYGNLTASGLPAIVIQDAAGTVIYKASGAAAPNAPWPLVKGVIECIRAHCPHCPRPKPTPAPEPAPVPDVQPGPPNLIPDVVGPNQNTPPDARDDTLPVTLAVFAVAAVASFIAAARRANDRYL